MKSDARITYHDRKGNRLVVAGMEATPDFWDDHWAGRTSSAMQLAERLRKRWPSEVVRQTRKYLPQGRGIILEGGCGYAQHVAALKDAGYNVIGVDYAVRTVDAVRRARPDLDVREGDVRALDLQEAACVGYWSLGVIEHFWEGYESILAEVRRVLTQDGILFLGFPCFSRLRRAAAQRGKYPLWDGNKPKGFYQFILDPRQVMYDLQMAGFDVLDIRFKSVRDGLRQDGIRLAPVLDRLEKLTSGSRAGRRAWFYIDRLLVRSVAWYCGHSVLLTARKRDV